MALVIVDSDAWGKADVIGEDKMLGGTGNDEGNSWALSRA